MSLRRVLLLALAFGPAVVSGAFCAETWPEYAPATRTAIFATGGDSGYIRPRNCHKGMGGALYRGPFREWLHATAPEVDDLWISTGNVSRNDMPEPAQPLETMWEHFARVGYAAAGVGTFELDEVGAEGVVRLARRAPFPVLAANLVVLETGLPAVQEDVILQTRAGRVAILGITPHRPEKIWGSSETGTLVTIDPHVVLADLVARVRNAADVVVLIAPLSSGALADLRADLAGVDVVLAQDAFLMPAEAERIGRASVLWLGLEGVRLGRVELGERGRLLALRGLPVDEAFPIDPATGRPRGRAAGPAAAP